MENPILNSKENQPISKDPYQGVLTKTNLVAILTIAIGVCLICAGLSFAVYNMLDVWQGTETFSFAKILWGVIGSIAGLLILVLGGIWKSWIDKKRIRAYSSVFVAKPNQKEKPKVAEKSEKDQTESVESVSVEKTNCPFCGEEIKNTKVVFCSNCGKKWDISKQNAKKSENQEAEKKSKKAD